MYEGQHHSYPLADSCATHSGVDSCSSGDIHDPLDRAISDSPISTIAQCAQVKGYAQADGGDEIVELGREPLFCCIRVVYATRPEASVSCICNSNELCAGCMSS